MRCVFCGSKKTEKIGRDEYECRNCESIFTNEDINDKSGRKSKEKIKYTKRTH